MLSTLTHTNLLLIEDNIECTEASIRLLNNFVSEIYHAIDSATALEILKTHPIDFIICDICLNQDENGLDLIESIRKKNNNIPIIIISGYQDTNYLMRSIPLSLTAYLIKPINYDSLLEALQLCSNKLMNTTTLERILIKGDFYYVPTEELLLKEEVQYKLNKKEILFFKMILQLNRSAITKDMFYEYVWEYHEMSDAALKNFIFRLRKRFGKNFIQTIHNIGYRI